MKRLKRLLVLYFSRNGPLFAKGIAYSLVLGTMPLLLLTTATAGYFYKNTPQIQSGLNNRVKDLVPGEFAELLSSNLASVSHQWAEIGIAGVLVLLFVCKGIFDAMGSGLDGVMHVRHNRIRWVTHLYSVIFTVMAVLIFILASLDNVFISSVGKTLNFSLPTTSYPVVVKLFSFLLLSIAFTFMYVIYSPARVKLGVTVLVSLGVSLLWFLLGLGGRYFVVLTSRREIVYGVFAGTVLFLYWFQIFAHFFLLGGIIIGERSSIGRFKDAVGTRPNGGVREISLK